MNKEYMVNGKTLVLPELSVEKYCAIIALVFGEGDVNVMDVAAKGPVELIGTKLNVRKRTRSQWIFLQRTMFSEQ